MRDLVWQIYLICEHGAVDLMTGAMAFPVRAAGESPAQMQPMGTTMTPVLFLTEKLAEANREIERLRAALTYIRDNGDYLMGSSCALEAGRALEQNGDDR